MRQKAVTFKTDTFRYITETEDNVSVFHDYVFRLLDLLKTNSRSPLLSLALARNEAGSCPSAEMRKGVPLPFLNRGRSSTCERFHFTSINTSQRVRSLKASSEIEASEQAESLQPVVELSPRRLSTAQMFLHTSAPRNLFLRVRV